MAEVIAAFETGTDVVIQQAIAFTLDTSNDAALRDGYIRLFTYLPSTLGERFIPFIEAVVPALLLVSRFAETLQLLTTFNFYSRCPTRPSIFGIRRSKQAKF